MKKQLVKTLLILIIMSICSPLTAQVKYPRTKKVCQKDMYFGVKVKDPYRWLEDDKSEKTANWVKKQNEVTYEYLSKISYRDSIKSTLTSMWNYEKYGLPILSNNYFIYSKNNGLSNQSIIYKRNFGSTEDKILIDPNTLSKDGTSSISNISISNDGKYIAYCLSQNGSDWNEICIIDENGNKVKDKIKGLKFPSIAWKEDGFFYNRYNNANNDNSLTATNENQSIFFHRMGTSIAEDKMIFSDSEHPKRSYSVSTTEGERFLIMSVSESTTGNALYYKNFNSDNHEFVPISTNFNNDYDVLYDQEDNLIILTNENATRYKIVKYNINDKTWSDLIPESDALLKSASISGDRIIVNYLKNAVSSMVAFGLNGNKIDDIRLPEMGNISGVSSTRNNPMLFFAYNTFTSPTTIYTINGGGVEPEIYLKPTVNLPEEEFITEQKFYPSKDGHAKIPMFIIHKRGIELDGNNPLMLYGYGGFNISLTPSFSVSRMLFLLNGGVYVVANIRGGGEYGRKWHEQGTLLNKQNTFDDFIAAAEYLIANKYTNSQKLAISGGSNGGLLVGACMTQRPELFKVALPAVGVLDMLRYHKFTIGWAWKTDYGTSENKDEFNYIYKYSPLHNINKRTVYPATLVTTADHDDRVVPAHSFKFIATLQKKGKHVNPTLIRVETNAGHGAGKPTSKAIDEATDMWAFTFYNLGMKFEPKYYR